VGELVFPCISAWGCLFILKSQLLSPLREISCVGLNAIDFSSFV
jgi:hypothetical protein